LATCSRSVLSQAPEININQIKGIGFDATCSLVAISQRTGNSISVSTNDENAQLGDEGERNVILWADHRAEKEAEEINASGEGVLGFVGGTMSVSIRVFHH
jgi:ribulose kinase